MKSPKDSENYLRSIVKKGIVACIVAYQKTLSPDHGVMRMFFGNGVCRFSPTCSEYTKQSVERHGMRGVYLGVRQLMRCHPFAK